MSPSGRVTDDNDLDGRKPGDWKTRYAVDAWRQIRAEAVLLAVYFLVFGLVTAFLFFLSADFSIPVDSLKEGATLNVTRHHLIIFFVGSVGSTVFAIKWLFHSVANGLWHQDRLLWRIFVPLTGGVYALVILALFRQGIGLRPLSGGIGSDPMETLALAFLIGYFADGVSGLLTNIANAIFGKVDKT
jgi:hypothetical protein